MSAFWIFTTCLTVVYFIYYTVVVWKDLAKPREQRSSSEETFVFEGAAPEPSKVVEMTDRGFQVEDGSGMVKEQAITNVPSARQTETEESDPGPLLDVTGAPVTAAGKRIQAAQDEMEPIDVSAASELVLEGMEAAIAGELDTVNIERKVTHTEQTSGDANTKKEQDHDGGQRI